MMMITAAVAAAGGRGVIRGRRFFSSPNLVLLGFAVLSFCGAAGDEEVLTHHGYARQGGSDTGLVADDYTSGFVRSKRDVGAPAPLARMPGEDTSGSTVMIAHRHLQGLKLTQGASVPHIQRNSMARHPLVTDGSGGGEDSQAVTIRRREEETLPITNDTLNNIKEVIVVQDEGIVYCPIAKVSSSEWKRTLRWMVGVESWGAFDGKLHSFKTNSLESLASRGLEETRWALESDRFTRFVVVRDPAERLVSAFQGKCILQGYERGHVARLGAPNCAYLTIMPELFPNTTKASLASHARLKELVEADPEDTFYHFAKGLWKMVKDRGDACKIPDRHHLPQACFCDLPNLLPAFHVMPLSNLSAEADALVERLPAALPDSGGGATLEITGVGGAQGMTKASYRRTGVDEARREEIRVFVRERFTEYHKVAPDPTHADETKSNFLSERVMEIIENLYAKDYDLLGVYF